MFLVEVHHLLQRPYWGRIILGKECVHTVFKIMTCANQSRPVGIGRSSPTEKVIGISTALFFGELRKCYKLNIFRDFTAMLDDLLLCCIYSAALHHVSKASRRR
jgi:hypothetical protein